MIREAGQAVYGWPTDEVEHVYGVPDKMADTHPTDLGNLKLPKGPNSRDDAEDRPLDEGDADNDEEQLHVPSYGQQRGIAASNRSSHASGTST